LITLGFSGAEIRCEITPHEIRLRTRIDRRPEHDAQVRELKAAGARQVFREVASGAKTDRAQLRRVLAQLAGDVLEHPSRRSPPRAPASDRLRRMGRQREVRARTCEGRA
jgi:hypothetical protein